MPFAIATFTALAAVAVLSTNHQALTYADAGLNEDGDSAGDAEVVGDEIADEFGGASGAIDEVINAR